MQFIIMQYEHLSCRAYSIFLCTNTLSNKIILRIYIVYWKCKNDCPLEYFDCAGLKHSRPEFLYFWGYFVIVNAIWIVIPSIVTIRAFIKIIEAVEGSNKKSRTNGYRYAPLSCLLYFLPILFNLGFLLAVYFYYYYLQYGLIHFSCDSCDIYHVNNLFNVNICLLLRLLCIYNLQYFWDKFTINPSTNTFKEIKGNAYYDIVM